MKPHYDILLGDLINHQHDPDDIENLTDLLKGFQGAFDASTGTLETPIAPPSCTTSGWWIVEKEGYVLIGGVATFFEAGDFIVYTLSTETYSRVDTKVNDAQVDITSTFSKLLSGLATQKAINEKIDKLVTVTTSAPGVSNDTSGGYFVGCFWINTSGSAVYQCKDATAGAAVWINLTSTGSEAAAAYRDFTDQSSDPAAPSASTHRLFVDSAGQLYIKDSSGNKVLLSPGTFINHIGTPGQLGFGVGICPPDLLAVYNSSNSGCEIRSMNGTFDINSANYGNYYVTHDNSIIVWVPFFWAKVNVDNSVSTKHGGYFADETAANAAGYFIPRGFINAGKIKRGVFMDKYGASLTGITAADLDANGSLANKGVLSSIKNGNPISCDAGMIRKLVTGTDNLYAGSFANCRSNTLSPADALYGAFDAVKSRGLSYHPMTVFERQILYLLAKAHQAAAVGTTFCAWNGVAPYMPKGNNNYGADVNDSACTFTACDDAYWAAKTGSMEARKCGSANVFAKTTHNGQNSGIADINGNQWIFLPGLTSICESAQAIVSITREAEAVVTVTNAAASKSNYANGKPVMILGTATTEWNTLLKDKIFIISDLSGNTFKIKTQAGAYVNSSALSADYASGLTSTTGKFYILKESIDVKNITGGVSGATDHWGATGIAAMFDEVNLFLAGSIGMKFGSGNNQVFSGEVNRTLETYKLSAALLPMASNSYDGSGITAMGNDYYYNYIYDNLAPLGFGSWSGGTGAGLAACSLYYTRTYSRRSHSVRACLYLV